MVAMTDLKANYPIYTLDNQVILETGAPVTEEAIESLISSSDQSPATYSSLLQHGSIRKDLLNLVSHQPYHIIFCEEAQVSELLNIMEKVPIPEAVLQSMNYFKKHDFYTYRHILMVFALTILLAKDLVSDYQDLLQEAMAGPMHDFGKISVPLSTLKKVQPLTAEERQFLQHHAIAGYVLLAYYLRDSQSLAARVARDHHERKDGSGYPAGIRLSDPLVEIIVACDLYDALLSPRPYRPTPYDNRSALEEITATAELGKLSWGVVQALVAYNRQPRRHYDECVISIEKRGATPSDSLYGVVVTHPAP